MGLFDNPFQNSFFSFAGQGERLLNAAEAIGASIQNIGSTITFGVIPSSHLSSNLNGSVGSVVQTLANHPLETAAVVDFAGGGAATAPIRNLASNAISSLSSGQKLVAVAATPLVAGIIASNPSGAVNSAISAPSNLADFGKQAGKIAQNPSIQGVQDIFASHPVLGGASAAAAIGLVGGTVSHLLDAGSRTINSLEIAGNTSALNSLAANPTSLIPSSHQSMSSGAPAPGNVAGSPLVTTSPAPSSIAKPKKKAKKKAAKKPKKKKVKKNKAKKKKK